MKKLALGVLCAAALTVTTVASISPMGASAAGVTGATKVIASAQPAGWVESVTDSRGGGTFAQVPFNVQFGSDNTPTGFHFNFKGMEDGSLYLRAPVAFTIQITNAKTKKVVWTGKTPVVAAGDFSSWKKFMTLDFKWDQKDAKGKRVAPGDYKANVIGPVTISYSKEPDSKIHTQTLNLSTINRGGVDIHIKTK